MRIAIIAALPGELKPLVKGWKRVATNERGITKWMLSRGADTWIAVCAGMGADAALRAYANAVSDGPVDMLLSAGWAGSLDAEVPPGAVQVPTIVIDAQTGEQFSLTEGKRKWRLVTTPRVADEAEKTRLAATYPGAVLVDMLVQPGLVEFKKALVAARAKPVGPPASSPVAGHNFSGSRQFHANPSTKTSKSYVGRSTRPLNCIR